MRIADTPPHAALLAEVADTLAWPLLLLQRDGILLHANLAARTLLQRGQWIALDAQHHLQLQDPDAQQTFMRAMANTDPAQHCLLRWASADGVVTATMTALTAAAFADDSQFRQHPPMLLALTLPRGRHADLQAFARLHALTPAEGRVLERLALGDNSVRVAQALGVAPTTVRAQTASLRRKTGHASVQALLHTLAALPPLAAASAVGSP